MRRIDPRADRGRRAKVERRSFDRRKLAGRNQRRIDRRVSIGVDRQLVPEDVAAAGKIEITVLRQVDVRRLVGPRQVVDDELVAVVERVGDLDDQLARITLFAVGAGVA